MAYTTIEKGNVAWGEGNGGPESAYFHLQDVSRVVDQPGAVSFNLMKAKVNGKDTTVIVGVSDRNESGAIAYLQEPHHLIALGCPPFTDTVGGVFLENP